DATTRHYFDLHCLLLSQHCRWPKSHHHCPGGSDLLRRGWVSITPAMTMSSWIMVGNHLVDPLANDSSVLHYQRGKRSTAFRVNVFAGQLNCLLHQLLFNTHLRLHRQCVIASPQVAASVDSTQRPCQ